MENQKKEAAIRAEITADFQHWNDLANGACRDPTWPDGCNMNLVRGHIIVGYSRLKEIGAVQINLFGEVEGERPIPPKVPDSYMVADGPYSRRLDGRLEYPVWGKAGEYEA